jgi:hypothetical protein
VCQLWSGACEVPRHTTPIPASPSKDMLSPAYRTNPSTPPLLLLLLPLSTQSLATFPEQVTDANLKAVSALQGVGKQTMKRVRPPVRPEARRSMHACCPNSVHCAFALQGGPVGSVFENSACWGLLVVCCVAARLHIMAGVTCCSHTHATLNGCVLLLLLLCR